MKHKTEEFLYFVLWTCDRLLDPTFRNLSGAFDEWCQRTGVNRHLVRLEQRQFVEAKADGKSGRMLRLTKAGRLAVFGGRDPREHWERAWDGQWQMIMFDLRLDQNTERQRLRRYLHSRGFGCLQKSVWVTPHPLVDEATLLADTKVNARSMFFLHAKPAAGESDEEIVSGTWDFDRINERWQVYLDLLESRPKASLQSDGEAQVFYEWTNAERRAWLHAISIDPLLPKPIWPEGYLGEPAWRQRQDAMASAAKEANG
jgi:DNA-binding transcriptional regulator PaaX